MDQHLQEAFLRGFERSLEKRAAVGVAARAIPWLGRIGSKVYGGVKGLFSSKTGRGVARSFASGVGSAAPSAGVDAMSRVFSRPQQPEGVPQGSMFQPGQRTLT